MNNKIIIGLLIGLVLVASVFAYSNKLTIRFILNNYKEECYEYRTIPEQHCRCNSSFRYANWCNWECCHCPRESMVYYNISILTNECAKYHLVRIVDLKIL